MQVVVMGAGVMGQRLAAHFMRAGFAVALLDPAPESLEAACTFLKAALLDVDSPILAARPDDLPHNWQACPLVIEAVPERLAVKHAALASAEAFFSEDTLIASNTSGLTTAELAAGMRLPGRLAIAHFFNPADVIPVVELIAGPGLTEARLQQLAAILTRSGKLPAILRQEVPGFVANRIQHAMMRECLHLLCEGVADAETLDRILRWSVGVRMAFFGPFLQRDLNGLDTHLAIAEYLYPQLAAVGAPPDILRDRVARGETGRKAGRGFYNWGPEREADLRAAEAQLADLIGAMLAGAEAVTE
ncbi:3-hydroxybutyryl-CoA dehydrogenase [Agrobacterium genomosp. 3]|jgi:3-hydroxybutyryl-CoA dehydrogenase|uniref:3-hydroxyacyl-CoA dehydrogenase family protein n=1 Tax=Agrobacterium tomkonis TaxID=1183410 RepID=UPI001CD8AA37|nr:3-hydroxybutyryl-CoA dehydrogenase [Agrobacterium tomkonis]MCA1879313.1 3-hydroxybutyryl-CoA dehydrogenase [Agrobacterium tumefaciens]MCA1894476.1 3-hydroxybutyryl-CoA dehydrogenase [Agrobacterium tomkonis]